MSAFIHPFAARRIAELTGLSWSSRNTRRPGAPGPRGGARGASVFASVRKVLDGVGRRCAIALFLMSALAIGGASRASVISSSLLFEAENQSMWSEGGAARWDVQTFIGTRWGTYAGGSAVDKSIGLDVGAASVRAGISSSGEIGIVPWASASGGGIGISLPMQATVTLPDTAHANSYFKVSTSGSIAPGYSILATAPNFSAGVDGLFNMDNRLYGEAATFVGCGRFGTRSCEWSGGINADLFAGRFSLLGFDTTETSPLRLFGLGIPGIEFDWQYLIHPTGVYKQGSSTPEPTPITGNFIVHNLQDKTGGVLQGNEIAFSTYQGIFESKLSITTIMEMSLFPGTPGLLRQNRMVYSNSIKDIYAGYVLADVSAGPILGMQQDFLLDPHPSVRLAFSKPVTRLEWTQVGSHVETQYISWCVPFLGCVEVPIGQTVVPDYAWVPVTYNDGVVEMQLGDEASLMFGDGFGELMSAEYFLKAPEFSNHTFATVDPGLQIQLLCARFTGLGETCVYDETFQTEGLVAMEVYSNNWVMQGFNSIKLDLFGQGPSESVPEPGGLLLVLSGLGLLSWSRATIGWRSRPRKSRDPTIAKDG